MTLIHGARVGKGYTPTYTSYKMMLARCYHPSSPSFKDYGAKGVRVCRRWRKGFKFFLADMGERPEGMTLDREDATKDYGPDNCRWATRIEQAREHQRLIEFNGECLPVQEWAKRLGIRPNALTMRIRTYKWPLERALTEGKHAGS